MHKSNDFQQGWDFIAYVMGVNTSTLSSEAYVGHIDDSIQKLVKDINSLDGTKQDAEILKGFVAEFWVADTFNIDAAVKRSGNRATVVGSTDFASADVSVDFGKDYSLKFYKNAKGSVDSQLKNFRQAYNMYLSKTKMQNPLTFEEYLNTHGYLNNSNDSLMSIYKDQGRIIPADQLDEARTYLERKIATESSKEGASRKAVLKNYKETYKNLSDRIIDEEGVESRPLARDEAKEIAEIAKKGDYEADFNMNEIITSEYLLKEALKAGYSAALVSSVMQISPEIIKAIDYLVKNGELDVDQLNHIGMKTISAGAEGFLRGAVSSALTVACKSGKMGTAFMSVSPQLIGALTILTIDTIKNSILVAEEKMEPHEMGSIIAKEVIISTAALSGGTIGQAINPALPVFGYMLGSLVGSVIASLSIDIGEKCFLSFCTDTGFTCFGLVKQDYALPDAVLVEMGISTEQIEKTYIDISEVDKVKPERIDVYRTRYHTVDYYIVKRGIIGINKVGYVL